MFLKALYDYAVRHRLLEELPLQKRQIHALIPLDGHGELRFAHLLPLTHADEKGKERPGQERQMPRFPGSNNGGKAYFLAADTIAVLGRHKDTGAPVPADPETAPRAQKTYPKAFQHFWQQIEDAFQSTGDARLDAMLAFRRRYLHVIEGRIEADLPFLEVRANKKTGRQYLFFDLVLIYNKLYGFPRISVGNRNNTKPVFPPAKKTPHGTDLSYLEKSIRL